MNALEIAQLYFDLSNKSDFEGIAKLMTPETHYKSETTGEFQGVDAILDMQKVFHGRFSELHWKVNSVNQIDEDTVCFDYDFAGTKDAGEQIVSTGLEYITVQNQKIISVEIKSKDSHP